MKALNPEEKAVIESGATEAPFSGRYWNHKADGTYVCRRCGAALYRSGDKFDSGCGWPSFDDAVPGAVRRRPDADGRRTEILCAACGGHLGHVFEGEGFTPKNTRHCVNSLSLDFWPREESEESKCTEEAIFAGGCFWGVEDAFQSVPGVCDVQSGYTGGSTPNPTYEDVCTGRTGHAEAVRVTYDPAKVSYEELAKLFFEIHDPTQIDRQGPDVGTQYRSAIFYKNDTQKAVAEKLIARLRQQGYAVATQLVAASVFYPAEDYHQDFTARTGRGGCHFRIPRFTD